MRNATHRGPRAKHLRIRTGLCFSHIYLLIIWIRYIHFWLISWWNCKYLLFFGRTLSMSDLLSNWKRVVDLTICASGYFYWPSHKVQPPGGGDALLRATWHIRIVCFFKRYFYYGSDNRSDENTTVRSSVRSVRKWQDPTGSLLCGNYSF